MKSDFGPQKGPASSARLRAQHRQLQKQEEEDAIQARIKQANDLEQWCPYCGYHRIKVSDTGPETWVCTKCFRQ